MLPRRIRAIALLHSVLLAAAAGAQQTSLGPTQVEAIEKEITMEMSEEGIPGLSAAVAMNGRVVWTNGYGFSDLENNVPTKASTVFRLGSISKPIAAVAAMKLVEEGKLRLEEPIQTYVPEFPVKPWPVNLRQLLGHLAGVRHYKGSEIESTRHYLSLTEALSIFKDDDLLSEPDTKYSYTTYGFTVVGCSVEKGSGMKFGDYVQQAVFDPAGMATAYVDDVFRIIPNRAMGYQKGLGGVLLNSGLADTSYKIPGGGFCSTSADLVKFAAALMDGKILRRESIELMWTSQKLRDGTETGYGLGFGVSERNGFKIVSHSGSQQRVNTILLLVPEKMLAVAVMCNLEGGSPTALARRIAAILSPELR